MGVIQSTVDGSLVIDDEEIVSPETFPALPSTATMERLKQVNFPIEKIPLEFVCPISADTFDYPVCYSEQPTIFMEAGAVMAHRVSNRTNMITNLREDMVVKTNRALRDRVLNLVECVELLHRVHQDNFDQYNHWLDGNHPVEELMDHLIQQGFIQDKTIKSVLAMGDPLVISKWKENAHGSYHSARFQCTIYIVKHLLELEQANFFHPSEKLEILYFLTDAYGESSQYVNDNAKLFNETAFECMTIIESLKNVIVANDDDSIIINENLINLALELQDYEVAIKGIEVEYALMQKGVRFEERLKQLIDKALDNLTKSQAGGGEVVQLVTFFGSRKQCTRDKLLSFREALSVLKSNSMKEISELNTARSNSSAAP